MANRIKCITVIFEESISEEYANQLCDAFSMFKSVIRAETHEMSAIDYIARTTAVHEIRKRLWDALEKADT